MACTGCTNAIQDTRAIDIAWASYYLWFDNGVAKGIEPDVVRELFRRMGMENAYQIKDYPFKRGHLNLKQGSVDMAFTADQIHSQYEHH